jgi:baseplate J-like protein
MITKVNNTISYLKNLWVEVFINKTDKVTDITDNSVLNGVAFGSAKVAQKALKDVAIVEAQIFPEEAAGDYLDRAASLFGVTPRKGALGSSTYIRVCAAPNTVYTAGVNTFVSNDGVRFQVEETMTVGKTGYGYVKVRSESVGAFTNVDANSIVTVTPIPQGHYECTNEYYAVGGRDQEDDEMFRIRILNHQNVYATATVEKLTQIFQNIDSRVLKIMYVGIMEDSFIHIQIATQNGQFLSGTELSTLLEKAAPYFGIGDMIVNGNLMGIKMENATWYEVGGSDGVDFRCELEPEFANDVATVRKNIQIGLTKYLDWRFWQPGEKVEWDNLLEIVKQAEGIRYVASEWFKPNIDEPVAEYMLPRIKKFVMRDLEGNVMTDELGETQLYDDLAPVFFPVGQN